MSDQISTGARDSSSDSDGLVRLRISIRGAVQGVGYRPFVYRLARELAVRGWVSNSVSGVSIEVEGPRGVLARFNERLAQEQPPQSVVLERRAAWLEPAGSTFEIRESDATGQRTALVLPDLAACADCLREVFDSADRRYLYPFTNCTNCGPRFTIIEQLPYDRANTSMKSFVMCAACQREYDDPADRRFHAQPNACPQCGPHLQLWDSRGQLRHSHLDALTRAADAIRDGAVVAVKGLGGFHLFAAAHRDETVRRLRELKHREEKPFALMFPSLDWVLRECVATEPEKALLTSTQAPIVLLRRHSQAQRSDSAISELVAPANPYLGIMLPYTPLHHLLLRQLAFPVIATSGNLAEEPICTDEHEAVSRLGGMVDGFLVHNRPIVRHADDSIVQVMAGRKMLLRRARGYAPLPVEVESESKSEIESVTSMEGGPILAVGAHLKNAIALAIGPQVFISQHIGDLETVPAFAAFERVIGDFKQFYQAQPVVVAADLHPDYLSTKYAQRTGLPMTHVQHHYAHILSCIAEHHLAEDVLGIAWDGTGFGTDATIWGGEFLTLTATSFVRVAHLRPFRLPGGEQAVREPRRSALGLLYELFGEAAFDMRQVALVNALSVAESRTFRSMLSRRLNSPVTSSMGRLFDAVAALLGVRDRSGFEGQAAMDLEFMLAPAGSRLEESYVWEFKGGHRAAQSSTASGAVLAQPLSTLGPLPLPNAAEPDPIVLDWNLMIRGILEDLGNGLPAAQISMKFHNSLVDVIVAIARQIGKKQVVLSGGCFQNRYLTEHAVIRLTEAGFEPHWHCRVPPNDGGIALGQVLAARRLSRARRPT